MLDFRSEPHAVRGVRLDGIPIVVSGMVDEDRKRVLLIAASILAARKLADWDGRPSPALESAIANAITLAERIMARIDRLWPQG